MTSIVNDFFFPMDRTDICVYTQRVYFDFFTYTENPAFDSLLTNIKTTIFLFFIIILFLLKIFLLFSILLTFLLLLFCMFYSHLEHIRLHLCMKCTIEGQRFGSIFMRNLKVAYCIQDFCATQQPTAPCTLWSSITDIRLEFTEKSSKPHPFYSVVPFYRPY